jgi:hypothetical protein
MHHGRVDLVRAALVVAALALAGCIERKETITVEPEGTVVIEADLTTGTVEDLWEGDAVPTPAGGWIVVETTDVDDEGRETFRLQAQAEFPPSRELPSTYATPGDPDEDLYLRFPTTVMIEERADGIYYHFHRRYPARAWAGIQSLRERLLEEKLKKLNGVPLEEISLADRALAVRCYVDFEAAKMLTFARAAFLDVTPDAPQDGWLAVRADILAHKRDIDAERIARLLDIEDQQERDAALQEEAERWEARTLKRLEDAVREHCGYGGRQMDDFLRRYERKKKYFAITEDLTDDAFEITVVLPGEIVGSNADSTGTDRATWKFGGPRFRDHDLELMATSRLDESD